MTEYSCLVCNKPIIQDRVDFLLSTGVAIHDLTCVNHSVTSKLKGIYFGEHGTSEIVLCDHVYDDSVRSKFSSAEEETAEEDTNNVD